MKNKSTKSPSAKSLRPNARVSVKAAATDSFQNFEARIGYGTGNVADGGSYNVNYLRVNVYRLNESLLDPAGRNTA